MSDYDIHSCGYYCDRHACILRQRDELRDKMFEEIHTSEGSIQISDNKEAESARAWVGLTDDEIDAVVKICNTTDTYKYFRAVEAKLKEKNT
jgi:hypothetical protein